MRTSTGPQKLAAVEARTASAAGAAVSRLRHWPLVVLGVLVVTFSACVCGQTFAALDRYQTAGYDLAIYDQAVWNTSRGDWFRSTYEPGWDTLLADHFEPILVPISLLYWLWPSPKALLLLQAIALALGALPVYWLARDRLSAALAGHGEATHPAVAQLAGLVFAAAYLLYPALQSTAYYDFHPSALAVPLLLYALHAQRRGRRIAAFALLVLAMSTKETMPLTTLAVGLYLLARREWRLGAATTATSAAWFILAVFVVIPHFSPASKSQYLAAGWYGWLGDSGSEIVTRILTRPDLIVQRVFGQPSPAYLIGLLGPLAFLSLLGLPLLLVALPTLALNSLSDFALQYHSASFFHYAAPLVPFVVVAASDGAAFLAGRWGTARGRRAVVGLVIALVGVASIAGHVHYGQLPLGGRSYLAPRSAEPQALDALVAQVPAGAGLSTERYLAPHLSRRRDLYLYPERPEAGYQLMDVGYRDWMFPARDRYDAIQSLLQNGEYGVRDGRQGYLLLEHGLDRPCLPEAFYSFVRAGEARPEYELDVDFGDELRLVGMEFHAERPLFPRAYLVLHWQALQPIDADLRLFAIQTDASGELLPGTELEFVESVWYPPAGWSPSERVRTETFHWYTVDDGSFGVAVGVVDGPGFWDVEKRLRPEVRAAPWDMPSIHGETLLWLGSVQTTGQRGRLQPPAAGPAAGR